MSIFITGCSKNTISFSTEEKEKVTQFLEELLLEHGGAYTLFGSKAITAESLLDLNEKQIEIMHQYLKDHPEIDYALSERALEKGWAIWKKHRIPLAKNYILTELQTKDLKILILANRLTLFDLLETFHQEFEMILKKKFSSKDLIEKLKNPKDEDWSSLLRNPFSCGILFGYGKKNAMGFEKEWKENSFCPDIKVSENNDPRIEATCYLNQKAFRIPIFAIFDEEEGNKLIQQYQKEREEICKIYSGKDFFLKTIDQLIYTHPVSRKLEK